MSGNIHGNITVWVLNVVHRYMRPCTPHYVLTQENSIVLGKHFFSSTTAASSCHGVVHSLLANKLVTNTAHPQTLHCLVAMLDWWIDLRTFQDKVPGLDCTSLIFRLRKSLIGLYGRIVVDCPPKEDMVDGRDYWLMMACVAIFFDALNLGTYKKGVNEDDLKSRTMEEVRAGYEGCRDDGVESMTKERGKIGATWVFWMVARYGYEETWTAGAVKRGADPTAKDPWYELLDLDWAPRRYRFCIRYVLHFACAMVWEQQILSHRGIVDPIHLKHLKERLALDILDFLGGEARYTLETMMGDVGRRMKIQPEVHGFGNLFYPDEGWMSDPPGPAKPPLFKFDSPFNDRIKDLQEEKVSIQRSQNRKSLMMHYQRILRPLY